MAMVTPSSNGGYGHCFVEILHDRYICKICYLPSRDPYLSVCCGHLFCESCLDNVKRAAAITNDCPVCRDKEFKTFPNKQIDREIKGFHIYCTNKEKGCEWQGELNTINNHLGNSDGCPFEEVKCSNECGKMIEQRYLTSHVGTECPRREVNCQYCHDTGEHQFIEGQHKEECPKLPLPCPNKCEVGSVPREDMEAHKKECPLEVIQCEYYSVGCKVRMTCKDQEKHNDEMVKEHLMMTKQKLDDIQHEQINTKAQLTTALKHITNLTVLVNSKLNPIAAAHLDNITIRSAHLDALAIMFESHPVCPVTIKMAKFHSKKKDGVEWYSDPFYTHRKGYNMCLCIYAAGHKNGKGTHISVYLCLKKGPYDDELRWPPRRVKLEVELLNQLNDSEEFSSTITYDDHTPDDCANRVTEGDKAKGWGWPRFISNWELYEATATCQYLKDDCLFFQVTKL